jgi:hypothetical protein
MPGHVPDSDYTLPASGGHRFFHFLGELIVVTAVNGHIATLPGQIDGHSRPNTLGAPSN